MASGGESTTPFNLASDSIQLQLQELIAEVKNQKEVQELKEEV